METVIENGNAEPTSKGAMLKRKMILPMQASFIQIPFSNIPTAIQNWPMAIKGMMI